MDYGTLIRNERNRLGLTLAELSKRSGVPIMTIYNWERGCTPTVNKLDKVLNALGVSVEIGRKQDRG